MNYDDLYGCEGCVWQDDCTGDNTICDDYMTFDDETGEAIERFIEEQRRDFRLEWTRYVAQFD